MVTSASQNEKPVGRIRGNTREPISLVFVKNHRLLPFTNNLSLPKILPCDRKLHEIVKATSGDNQFSTCLRDITLVDPTYAVAQKLFGVLKKTCRIYWIRNLYRTTFYNFGVISQVISADTTTFLKHYLWGTSWGWDSPRKLNHHQPSGEQKLT